MKVIINRLFEPRYPLRYIGRHRAPSTLPALSMTTLRRARSTKAA